MARNDPRLREGSRAGWKRTKADIDDVEDYGGEGRGGILGREVGKYTRVFFCCQESSSSRVLAAPLQTDFDSRAKENADKDSESGPEDLE